MYSCELQDALTSHWELRQRRVSPEEVLGVLNREISLILKY